MERGRRTAFWLFLSTCSGFEDVLFELFQGPREFSEIRELACCAIILVASLPLFPERVWTGEERQICGCVLCWGTKVHVVDVSAMLHQSSQDIL